MGWRVGLDPESPLYLKMRLPLGQRSWSLGLDRYDIPYRFFGTIYCKYRHEKNHTDIDSIGISKTRYIYIKKKHRYRYTEIIYMYV